MLAIVLKPLSGADEVSGNVVLGGQYHTCCCGFPWTCVCLSLSFEPLSLVSDFSSLLLWVAVFFFMLASQLPYVLRSENVLVSVLFMIN
jgi:hypothetical protein